MLARQQVCARVEKKRQFQADKPETRAIKCAQFHVRLIFMQRKGALSWTHSEIVSLGCDRMFKTIEQSSYNNSTFGVRSHLYHLISSRHTLFSRFWFYDCYVVIESVLSLTFLDGSRNRANVKRRIDERKKKKKQTLERIVNRFEST